MAASIGWILLLVFLGVLLLLLTVAALVSLVLPSMILRASCSVADVNEPRYAVSFPLGYGVVLFYLALCWAFVSLLGRLDVDPEAPLGAMHVCGYLVALAVGFVLAALFYRLVLAPTFLKGLRVAGLQLALTALVAALAAGVLLATLSVWQLLGFGLPWSNAPAKPAAAHAAPLSGAMLSRPFHAADKTRRPRGAA
jgi:hypothetical protein